MVTCCVCCEIGGRDRIVNVENHQMLALRTEERDREICRILQTHPSELEGILGLSRQTIAKRIEENRLFSVEQVVKVADRKIANEAVRSRTVAHIFNDLFPDVIRATRDTDVTRFERYCFFGMGIHAEISAHPAFEDFVRRILSDEEKFILFICRPQKEHAQLKRWLKDFQREKQKETASFALLPCKLTEFAPTQIIADLWSNDPKFIQFTDDYLYVDEQSAKRAIQLAGALMDYGLSERACEAIDKEEVLTRLLRNLNSSLYDETKVDESEFLTFVNK
jgi:hypothetical protein